MKLFKNKNPEKIEQLKNSNNKLRSDYDYIIASVKTYGSSELEYVSPEIMKRKDFILKLVKEIPQAAAIIPDVVYDTYLDENNELQELEIPGHDLALVAYCESENGYEIYKYMRPEHAMFVREFEGQGSVYGFPFGGAENFYKLAPVYHPTYINDEPDPKYHEEGMMRRKAVLSELDEIRPDVAKLAEEKQEESESTN